LSSEGSFFSDEESDKRKANGAEENGDVSDMMKIMGFTDFDSSKGKSHKETALEGVHKTSTRKPRQYMNRRGGFNRPLSPVD